MTSSAVSPYHGLPCLHINGQPIAAVAAYVKPAHIARFRQAGVNLYTALFSAQWWLGADEYDFSALDQQFSEYCAAIPGGYLMPRIDFAPAGFPWWGQANPDEMVVMRSIATGEKLDPAVSDPRGEEHLHHGVHLQKLNLHSFHSLKWREDAGRAIAALVRFTETRPYADQIWAWHICDGWPQEWFHWGEYLLDGLEDYSPAAQDDFRRWLRATYQDDEQKLQAAWGSVNSAGAGDVVTFDTAQIPSPAARARTTHGEFYDPVRDRPTIDYTQCMSDSVVDSITAVCQAAKDAMREPKVVCAFYGYPFCHLPRPQLIGHNALARLLASPAVDLIASPHSYDNRGYGGYHSPQAMADSARRAGKMHFDEVDCKTIWTPKVRWKDNISEPETLTDTLEMMKKDAAYATVSASAMWWCDLFHQGWYDADECVEPIRRMRQIEQKMLESRRSGFGEVALVVSERAQMFQAQKDGLVDATREMFRNWFLSRMGAPFEQLLLSDLARPDLPDYKLYIMADAFYLSQEERAVLRARLQGRGATALWVYAPGFLDERSAGLDNMYAATGIHFGQTDRLDELNVHLARHDHPITAGLPEGLRYGTGVDREQYLRPPKIQYLPDTRVSPAFYADDPEALVLGIAENSGRAGLVVKEGDGWRSIYSAAPLLSWPLLRNIARWAGVHLYSEQGDMIWANDQLLVIYSQEAGQRTIRFPTGMTGDKERRVEDAYHETPLPWQARSGCTRIDLQLKRYETRCLLLKTGM